MSSFRLPFERPATSPGPWASEPFLVPTTVASALQELVGGPGLAPALLAALDVVLYRYTGRTEAPVVLTGPPARLHTAPVTGAGSSRELVQRIEAAASTADVLGDGALSPQSSVAFSSSWGTSEDSALVNVAGGVTLRLSFDQASGRRGCVSYHGEAFTATEVRRLIAHLVSIIGEMAARPDAPVATLSMLSAAEESKIRGRWNATSLDFPRHRLAHELCTDHAAASPEAVAVTASGSDHTYGELQARADALTGALRRAGVGAGDIVGLCVDRSFEMVAGVLGILQVGAAYLPLDPSYPAERLAYMVEDSRSSVVVAQRAVVQSLPPRVFEAARLVFCDDYAGQDQAPEPEAAVRMSPEHAAYVIYTSGSTGRPKGVVVPHRALTNLFAAIRERMHIGPHDVVLGLSPLSFDISVLELLLTLMAGGRVHMVERALATDGRALAAEIAGSGATVVQATPATFRMLVAAGWQGSADLTLIAGGEALAPDLAAALLDRCGRLWNGYGPTEATVYSLTEPITREIPIAIGRPLGNTRAYVLDDHLNPLPVGVPGELYLAGDGLAHGYLGRPGLTAERFVPDPFGSRPGARLYRTGDLTRWTDDGRVEYLGRIDHQVKLRGYRIELGEVEATLREHPAVREAVAAVVEREGGEPVLAGYLELLPGELPSREDVRRFAGRSLPEFMTPTELLVVDRMPLTPSNKVDRAAVGALRASARPLPAQPRTLPRTALELVVMSVWIDVLGRDDLGVDEPVFDYGADSLAAQRTAYALEDIFRIDVPIRTIFERPTVEGLAVALEASGRRVGRDVLHTAERLLSLTGQSTPFQASHSWNKEAVA